MYAPVLDFAWVTASLEAIMVFEQGKVARARVRNISREVVSICRLNRERVIAAEKVLDAHRDVLTPEQHNAVLRLMAEVLLYVQFRGVRMKVGEDPWRILRGT